MPACTPPAVSDLDHSDQSALRMMLCYVEAECLRLGATDAARHAALAAALMPRGSPAPRPHTENRADARLH